MLKQAQALLRTNTNQCVSLVTGKIRPFGIECGRNKAYELRLGDNYTNGSARSLPLSTIFSKRDLSPWFLLSPLLAALVAPVGHRIGSTRHQRVNPCFTASETEAVSGVLQGCGEGGKEGGVRPNISASNPQAPRQADTEGLHEMRNRSRSIYFSAVEIRPTTA